MANRTNLFILSALAAVLSASCQDDDLRGLSGGSDEIRFSVTDEGAWTRSSLSAVADSLPRDTACLLTDGAEGRLWLAADHADGFAGTDAADAATRAAEAVPDFSSFRVSAYSFTGAWTGGESPDVMNDVPVTRQGGVWLPDRTYYMPSRTCSVNFFGYAPADAAQLAKPSGGAAGYPAFLLTVPNDMTGQKDVVFGYTAAPVPSANREAIPLQFRHTLTQVRLAYGVSAGAAGDTAVNFPAGVHITEVRLSGIHDRGTAVHKGDGRGFERWRVSGLRDTTSYVIGGLTAARKEVPGGFLTDRPLLLMPQEFNDDNARLTVSLSQPVNGKRTLTASLKDFGHWMPGKAVTYRITTRAVEIDTVFVIEAHARVATPDGLFRDTVLVFDVFNEAQFRTGEAMLQQLFGPGVLKSDNFTIKAYTKPKGGTDSTRLDYSLSYMYNAEFCSKVPYVPGWTDDKLALKRGEGVADTLLINIPMAGYVSRSTNSQQMYDRPERGAPGAPWDLSTHDLCGEEYGRTTANCYVIDRAGWYSLPLVHGSAYQNGVPKPESYGGGIFYDGLGLITSPEIHGAAVAELIWEDAQSLVTDVRLEGDRLVFRVPKGRIMEGNAVVGVRDGHGTLIWSWHLWMSNKSFKPVANWHEEGNPEPDYYAGVMSLYAGSGSPLYGSEKEHLLMMRTPIGSMEANRVVTEQRFMSLSLQLTGGVTRTLTMGHKGSEEDVYFRNCLYYQWGRKDPIFPNDGIEKDPMVHRHIYSHLRLPKLIFAPLYGDAKERCRNIETFDNTYPLSLDVRLWNPSGGYKWGKTADTDAENFVKTVYDPSPAGYRIPMLKEFGVFIEEKGTALGNIFIIRKWREEVEIPNPDGVPGVTAARLENQFDRQDMEFMLIPYFGRLSRVKDGDSEYWDFGKKAWFWCASVYDRAQAGGAMRFTKNNTGDTPEAMRDPQELTWGLPVFCVTEHWYNEWMANEKGWLKWNYWPLDSFAR